MKEFAFIPTKNQENDSNIARLIKKLKLSSIHELSEKSQNNLEWFWECVSNDIGIVWDKKYQQILDTSNGLPWSKWFVGGQTNIYKSSVEKFAKSNPDKIAYYFESEDATMSKITYSELDQQVSKIANGLKKLGVKKGDVVAIYLPMIKEAILTILASAKIGAVQTVIFSGYSSDSLHVRLQDCNAKILIVSDGFYRKGKPISQKSTIESAIQNTSIQKVLVVPYKHVDNYVESEKIIFYDSLVSNLSTICPTEKTNSEDPLFILYTSGTTGKPKGVIHVHGGFSVFAGHQAAYLIDTTIQDILLWPADIGWITGLVWNVYGMLLIGATAVIYDGALDYPNYARVWEMVDKYNATIFGISPTAVRMYKKNSVEPLKNHNLNRIKNIATTGEPLDEDSWWWLFEKIGSKKIPIMNLSGGTEIGGAMLSVFPGIKLKPSTVGIPVPGMHLDVFDENGKSVTNTKGYLVIKAPWPGMTIGLLNANQRYLETYWSRFDNAWFHGDYVLKDSDGLWYMHGRVDDVINVSGHRMSTAEIEQTVISHNKIADAASISIPDSITGEAIVLFIVPESKTEHLEADISDYIASKIGKLAKPKFIFQISELPKTRTGKIMRRLLKSKLLGHDLGDLSSLENPHVLDEVKRL
ncbi:MAG: AMP-binding protein [Nitrosopumilaceae archaeon]|nr:AMP-binding protein [Nitrosopumilaceae archaeon]